MTFLNKIKRYLGVYDYTDYYTIQKMPNGRYGIYDADGFTINTYTRRTDAVRGAARNGLTLV